MDRTHLNEHDACRGAESTGEFLGMTGNSAWYLFGSSGASILLVIVLWGVLGFSLLLCLLLGLALCGLSIAYVFALKNNRPTHYDTDFFESALVEAGLMRLAFGPREKRLMNPFRMPFEAEDQKADDAREPERIPVRPLAVGRLRDRVGAATRGTFVRERTLPAISEPKADVPLVPLAVLERLQNELNTTTEMLEEALADREEDRI